MRTIIFVLILLSSYFGISVSIGLNWAIGIFGIFLASLGTVFVIKKSSYYKYIEFVNPKYANIYNTKNDSFKKNLRTTEIIVLYVLSSFMMFISIIMPNIVLPIDKNIVYSILSTIILTLSILYFILLIFKKSKKNSTFWFYFIALIFSSILVFSLVANFIL